MKTYLQAEQAEAPCEGAVLCVWIPRGSALDSPSRSGLQHVDAKLWRDDEVDGVDLAGHGLQRGGNLSRFAVRRHSGDIAAAGLKPSGDIKRRLVLVEDVANYGPATRVSSQHWAGWRRDVRHASK